MPFRAEEPAVLSDRTGTTLSHPYHLVIPNAL